MLDTLEATRDDALLARLAQQYGLSPEQMERVAAEVLPMLKLKLEERSLSRGGLADLVDLIGQTKPLADARDAGNLDGFDATMAESYGIPVLSELLGSRDSSRFLANSVAKRTGVDYQTVKRVLPGIGAATMASVAHQTAGTFGDIFSKLPQVPAGAPASFPQQEMLPVPGKLPGTGTRGGRSPFDDLSDILRRGGRGRAGGSTGQLPGGGALGKILRDALGSALGYRNSGIMGWIIRYFVMRYGWRIVSWFFGRMLGGR